MILPILHGYCESKGAVSRGVLGSQVPCKLWCHYLLLFSQPAGPVATDEEADSPPPSLFLTGHLFASVEVSMSRVTGTCLPRSHWCGLVW